MKTNLLTEILSPLDQLEVRNFQKKIMLFYNQNLFKVFKYTIVN